MNAEMPTSLNLAKNGGEWLGISKQCSYCTRKQNCRYIFFGYDSDPESEVMMEGKRYIIVDFVL